MANGARDSGEDRSETIAFRTSRETKHLLMAVSARREEPPSDWLRRAVDKALHEELDERVAGRDQETDN